MCPRPSHRRVRAAIPLRSTCCLRSGAGWNHVLVEEYLIHPAPREIAQQRRKSSLHGAQVEVVTKLRLEAHATDTRLRRIELPGMAVEDARAVLRVYAAHRPPRGGVGQQTKIASPGGREVPAEQF